MHSETEKEVSNSKSRMRCKATGEETSIAVRIRRRTKAKMELMLRQCNRDRPGNKVKIDDLVLFALDLITDQHLADICSRTLSNKDRIELIYRNMSKVKRGLTRDEFFGLLLAGKVTV